MTSSTDSDEACEVVINSSIKQLCFASDSCIGPKAASEASRTESKCLVSGGCEKRQFDPCDYGNYVCDRVIGYVTFVLPVRQVKRLLHPMQDM